MFKYKDGYYEYEGRDEEETGAVVNSCILHFGYQCTFTVWQCNSDINIKIIIIVKGGMKRQLEELCHILKYVDPVFYSYLDAKVELKESSTFSMSFHFFVRNLEICISASAGCSSGSRESSASRTPALCGRLSGQRCEFHRMCRQRYVQTSKAFWTKMTDFTPFPALLFFDHEISTL